MKHLWRARGCKSSSNIQGCRKQIARDQSIVLGRLMRVDAVKIDTTIRPRALSWGPRNVARTAETKPLTAAETPKREAAGFDRADR
jgi:hypothetical protein